MSPTTLFVDRKTNLTSVKLNSRAKFKDPTTSSNTLHSVSAMEVCTGGATLTQLLRARVKLLRHGGGAVVDYDMGDLLIKVWSHRSNCISVFRQDLKKILKLGSYINDLTIECSKCGTYEGEWPSPTIFEVMDVKLQFLVHISPILKLGSSNLASCLTTLRLKWVTLTYVYSHRTT